MYKDIDEHITSSSAVEGLGRGGGASGVEEGAVEGHGRARRRGTGAHGGGPQEVIGGGGPHEVRRGLRCHGR